jgi:hypothetical protein
MAGSRATESSAPAKLQARMTTPWGIIGRRQMAELAMPGIAIGLLGGLIAGGLAAAGGLAPDVALVSALALAIPLAIAGAGYELLLARGRFPLSALTPVALFFAVAFPVVRILHAAITDFYAGDPVAVPYGWLDFIVYQVLLSVGFAIGYWWLHENFAPRWWYELRDRNPVADHFIRVKLAHADAAEQRQQERKQKVQERREERKRSR